jgi:hypothetical protein
MQNEPIENSPLTSNDQAKLLIFALLFVPSILFLGGIIPAILLAFGIYMTKKNQDFSHIDVAFKNFRKLTFWLSVAGFFWAVAWSLQTYNSEWFVPLLFLSIPAYAYFIAVDHLFYRPLKSRYLWVEKNGVFSNTRTSPAQTQSPANFEIIKGEMLKQYSVADELLKWAKLKEDGHITEKEFNEARTKLLKG